MLEPNDFNVIYRFGKFGKFVVDCETIRLLVEGEPVNLRDEYIKTLILLVKSAVDDPQSVVVRNDILEFAWGMDRFPEPSSADKAVSELRRVFGEGPREGRFIKTIPGTAESEGGYRFVCPILTADVEASAPRHVADYGEPETCRNTVSQGTGLAGAIRIDENFIESVRNGPECSRAQFYSAMAVDNCQWYGVLKNFDVLRKDYEAIKKRALLACKKLADSKVALIVHGPGGSGKSTLLRRLALDYAKGTEFRILWVEELEHFVKSAVPIIRNDTSNKHIVFIEDWETLTSYPQGIGLHFLNASRSIKNVRIIIGDRSTRRKPYLNDLLDKNLIELELNENTRIVSEIVLNFPDWSADAKPILANPALLRSPLFLILFVIAALHEKRVRSADLDLSDLENSFKRIAEYDLRQIKESAPGIANALHYWACQQAEEGWLITFDAFLLLAKYLDPGGSTAWSRYEDWTKREPVLELVKHYLDLGPRPIGISLGGDQIQDGVIWIEVASELINLLQFKHEMLADAVSKVDFRSDEIWSPQLKKSFLDDVAQNADSYSASVILSIFLLDDEVFKDNQEKKRAIDYLFKERHVRYLHYLTHLRTLDLEIADLFSYVWTFIDENDLVSALFIATFALPSLSELSSDDEHDVIKAQGEAAKLFLFAQSIESEKYRQIAMVVYKRAVVEMYIKFNVGAFLGVNPESFIESIKKHENEWASICDTLNQGGAIPETTWAWLVENLFDEALFNEQASAEAAAAMIEFAKYVEDAERHGV